MDYLGPLCLLMISFLHCVYAGYDSQFELYNPATGQTMDPRLLRLSLRSSIQDMAQPTRVSDNIVKLPSLGMPCSCADYTCRCCLGIGFSGEKRTVCINIQYDWRRIGVRFFIDWNDRTLASFGFSAVNVPDFCIPLVLPIPVFSCLRLADVQLDDDNSFSFCNSLVFKIVFQQVYEYRLSCFRFSTNGVFITRQPFPLALPAKAQEAVLIPPSTNDKLQLFGA